MEGINRNVNEQKINTKWVNQNKNRLVPERLLEVEYRNKQQQQQPQARDKNAQF